MNAMQTAFQKLMGWKDNEEDSKALSTHDRDYPGLPSAMQNMSLSSEASISQTPAVASQNPTSGSGPAFFAPTSTAATNTPNRPRCESTGLPQTSSAASSRSGRLKTPEPSSTAQERAQKLGQIPLPPLCRVCRNFDPYKAPPDRDVTPSIKPWANREYNISLGIPISKITIEKSEELIESAKRGCLFCNLVDVASGTISPGWEREKSFIHIFLAPRLPVYLRLEFGATSTVTIGREGLLELGINAREGQTMDYIITVEDPSKPAIDVEIYRPFVSPDKKTVADRVLEPLVRYIGFAEEIPKHAGDEQCFDFIKEKIETCMNEHKCSKDGQLPLLPDRVIWVEANQGGGIQLVEPKNIRANYIALSYCWGPVTPRTYLTNASTYNTRKAGIAYDDLPPLIQDVVSCTRRLGIEYVWIDRLCIVQGDIDDFRSQAPKMGEIYGNATLTIAAATATSEADHILVERAAKWQAYSLKFNTDRDGALTLRFRRRTHPLGKETLGGDYGKISTRAWAWQERLLSARTIFYTPSALKFECRCHSIWEGFSRDLTGHSWSSKLDNISHDSWTALVEEYMKRDITRISDRLPAMEATMKRIQKSKGWSPLWGMWANTLVESLGWESSDNPLTRTHAGRMNPGHYAPTWSWASVDGRISHSSTGADEDISFNDTRIFDLKIGKIDAASGMINVSGRLILVHLSCRVDVGPVERGQSVQEGLKYTYEVRGIHADNSGPKSFGLHPDVALKPWSGDIDGRHIKTVIRVPYGEVIPKKSWTARCLCLLVCKNTLRSLVLFLGASLRVPGAWERIGMVDEPHPAIFENSQIQTFNIV